MSDGRETAWLLLFDEQGKPFEVFSGHGAEDAARRRFEQASINWNCHLFEKIAPLDSARPEALRRQVCFGIFDSEGKMHVSENCISDCSAVLADELHYLQRDEPDDGWHIAPMFIETTPSPLRQKP